MSQALGRCIRHKNDFGAVFLLDSRHCEIEGEPRDGDVAKCHRSLPKWMNKHIRNLSRDKTAPRGEGGVGEAGSSVYGSWAGLASEVSSFFKIAEEFVGGSGGAGGGEKVERGGGGGAFMQSFSPSPAAMAVNPYDNGSNRSSSSSSSSSSISSRRNSNGNSASISNALSSIMPIQGGKRASTSANTFQSKSKKSKAPKKGGIQAAFASGGSGKNRQDAIEILSIPPSPPPLVPQAASLGPPPPVVEATTERDECSVCMENKKNTLLLPCKHVCICHLCAEDVTECPLCKTTINQKIPGVYF